MGWVRVRQIGPIVLPPAPLYGSSGVSPRCTRHLDDYVTCRVSLRAVRVDSLRVGVLGGPFSLELPDFLILLIASWMKQRVRSQRRST